MSKITIKNGIEKIPSFAFNACKATEIWLPDSIEEIESCAFYNCKKLQKVVFGKNIGTLPEDIFVDCPDVNEIVIPSNAKLISSDNKINSLVDAVVIFKPSLDTAEKEMAKKIGNFLKTGMPEFTLRLKIGKQMIWIPRIITTCKNEICLVAELKSRIHDGSYAMSANITEAAPNYTYIIGMAIEQCIIEKDHDMELIMPFFIEYLLQIECDDETLMQIIKFGIANTQNYEEILRLLADNDKTEVTAYALEQIRTQNHFSGPDLTL